MYAPTCYKFQIWQVVIRQRFSGNLHYYSQKKDKKCNGSMIILLGVNEQKGKLMKRFFVHIVFGIWKFCSRVEKTIFHFQL